MKKKYILNNGLSRCYKIPGELQIFNKLVWFYIKTTFNNSNAL